MFTADDIRWFAENAQRQRVGPMRVWSMAQAAEWYAGYDLLREDQPWTRPPTVADILQLGALVEPNAHNVSTGAFRNVAVFIGQSEGAPWPEVPRLIAALCDTGDDLTPDDWYREFETIHPFRDGNGRTGAILWNGAIREFLVVGRHKVSHILHSGLVFVQELDDAPDQKACAVQIIILWDAEDQGDDDLLQCCPLAPQRSFRQRLFPRGLRRASGRVFIF